MKKLLIALFFCTSIYANYGHINDLIADNYEHTVIIGIKYGQPIEHDGVISIREYKDYYQIIFYDTNRQSVYLEKQNITYIDIQ